MIKSLYNVDIKNVMSFDIETVRIVDNYEDLSEDLKVAWAYKHKTDKELPNDEVLAELWKGKDSAVNAEFAKVCAISMAALDNEGKLACVEIFGKDELDILTKASDLFNKKYNKRVCGHASEFFDIPFILKRMIINNVQLPSVLDVGDAKPWERTNLDTFNIWKLGGSTSCSLVALCASLGIPISKGDLSGAHVDVSYYAGEYERIGRYCSHDTVATFNIICRLKELPLYDFDDVNYVQI
jgi:3'-5' exonuclease